MERVLDNFGIESDTWHRNCDEGGYLWRNLENITEMSEST